jgi:hypothetical protein
MQDITIETNIPAPSSKGKYMHLLKVMDVGNSILIPNRTSAQVSSPIAIVRKQVGFIYRTRKEGDGVRIWRIA